MLARLELLALLPDFIEQTYILDGDYRLIGEGSGQFDLLGVNDRCAIRAITSTPTGRPPARGARQVRFGIGLFFVPTSMCIGVGENIGDVHGSALKSARPVAVPRPGTIGCRSRNS